MADIIVTERLWESDPATHAQLDYIMRYQMIPREETRGLTKGRAKNIIQAFREKHDKKPLDQELSTDAQINYIKKLCADLGLSAGTYIIESEGRITKRRASVIITELKSQLTEPVKTQEGMYKVGTNVYKVKKNQWDELGCYKMIKLDVPEEVSNGIRTYKFVPDRSMLRALANVPRMSQDEAREFAADTSTCVRCGIQLEPTITNPDGSPRWIGPICQTKMGW